LQITSQSRLVRSDGAHLRIGGRETVTKVVVTSVGMVPFTKPGEGGRQVEGARLALQHNLGLGGACVVTLPERVVA
jgi:hypothetical protein